MPGAVLFPWRSLLLLIYLSTAATQCYFPNGDPVDDFPCNPDAESSACCGGGKYGGTVGIACLSNNMCQGTEGKIVRGSCTDPGFGEGCPRYCLSPSGGADMVSCSNVTDSDTSYCCATEAGCCDSGVGRFELLPSNPRVTATWNSASFRFVAVETSSSSATSQAFTSSATPKVLGSSTASTSTLEPSDQLTESLTPPSVLPAGAKAGIGVGIGLAGVNFAGLAYILWKFNKLKGSNGDGDESRVYELATDVRSQSNPQELSTGPS